MNNTSDTLAAFLRSENIILKNALKSIQDELQQAPTKINSSNIDDLITAVNKVYAILANTESNIEDIENAIIRIVGGESADEEI